MVTGSIHARTRPQVMQERPWSSRSRPSVEESPSADHPGEETIPGQPEEAEHNSYLECSDPLVTTVSEHIGAQLPPHHVSPEHDGGAAMLGPDSQQTSAIPHRSAEPDANRRFHISAHALTLALLAASDMTFCLWHWHDLQDVATFYQGFALVLLYVLLMAWLLGGATGVSQPASTSAGPPLGHLHCRSTGWFVPALLQTITVFFSAWWRQALQSCSHAGGRAACVTGICQMLVTVLYPIDGIRSAVLSLTSFLVLVAFEFLHGASWEVVFDDAALLASAGVACAVAIHFKSSASAHCGSISRGYGRLPHDELKDIFGPILTEQSPSRQSRPMETRLDQLVLRLEAARGATQQSDLDCKLRGILEASFDWLLHELAHLSSINHLSTRGFQGASPMTVEYIRKTLNQDVTSQKSNSQSRVSTPRNGERFPLRSGKFTFGGGITKNRSLHGQCTPRAKLAGHPLPETLGSSSSCISPMPGAEISHLAQDEDLVSGLSPQCTLDSLPEERTFSTLSGFAGLGGTADVGSPMHNAPGMSIGEEDEHVIYRDQNGMVTFKQGVAEMMERLHCCQREEFLAPPELSDELTSMLEKTLGAWSTDVFKLERMTSGRPLIFVGAHALTHVMQKLCLESERVSHFLDSVESRYPHNPYHNSLHAADVVNSMLYFLRVMKHDSEVFDPMECLAALCAAASHDVGHDGLSNAFQVAAQTALSRLYNDQSCLENMHCSIAFSVLRADSSNFMTGLPASGWATFRSWVTRMILETDLSKHVESVSRFKQEYATHRADPSLLTTAARRREVAAFALKCCDVAHSTKPFDLHVGWTLRITDEFFRQGDLELQLGLACSPFCDRTATNVADSQGGFFDYIVGPMYTAFDEYLGNRRLREEILSEMTKNSNFWRCYDGTAFSYEEPMSNIGELCCRFQELNKPCLSEETAQPAVTSETGLDYVRFSAGPARSGRSLTPPSGSQRRSLSHRWFQSVPCRRLQWDDAKRP